MNAINIGMDELSPYVRRVGMQESSGWENTYRKIYDYEWMYILNGTAYYQTPEKSYTLSTGYLLLIKPNLPHKFWVDPKSNPEIIWIHFDFIYRKDVYSLENLLKHNYTQYFNDELPEKKYLRQEYIIENRFTIPEILKIDNSSYIEYKFRELLSHYSNHYMTWQLKAKADLLLIIQTVLEQLSGKQGQNLGYHYQISEQIKSYLDEYYFRKLTRKDIANYFGYSEDYIGKLFKKYYLVSISEYLNHTRIEKAKELLVNTDLSITAICELVGYSDVYYFSNKMKKLTGASPSQWRKKHHVSP